MEPLQNPGRFMQLRDINSSVAQLNIMSNIPMIDINFAAKALDRPSSGAPPRPKTH
jgi:hypothetical protein